MSKELKNSTPMCECHEVHSATVEKRRESMPDAETLYDLADFFKILGDSTRISILFAIDGEPLCVCDVAELLGMTQSAISHQLRVLRGAKLIKSRRQGKTVYYSLSDDHVITIINSALDHVKE